MTAPCGTPECMLREDERQLRNRVRDWWPLRYPPQQYPHRIRQNSLYSHDTSGCTVHSYTNHHPKGFWSTRFYGCHSCHPTNYKSIEANNYITAKHSSISHLLRLFKQPWPICSRFFLSDDHWNMSWQQSILRLLLYGHTFTVHIYHVLNSQNKHK